jgi:hypothetical protein
MLSKTNNEDPNQSREISNVGKSIKGQYDKLVEDFEDLIEKRKLEGDNHKMSQSQMERRLHPTSSPMTQSHMGKVRNNGSYQNERVTFQDERHPSQRDQEVVTDHTEEIEAYNRIIQEQLQGRSNQGQQVNYGQQESHRIKTEANYDSDLNKYFDTEINEILDKIKRCKVEGVNDCDVNLGSNYKLMNCSNSLKRGEMQVQKNINTGSGPHNRISTTEYREIQSKRNTQKAREMFEDKDIEELKNRVKAITTFQGQEEIKERSQTFQGKLKGDKYLKNLVKPELNRMGEVEGEIEMMKRKTIQATTPKESVKSSIEAELLSKRNDGDTGRRSQNSGNFSFNPRNCKSNMNAKMNEMIDQMDIQPVKKNVTVSMVMDGFEQKSPEELRELRDKANTTDFKGNP